MVSLHAFMVALVVSSVLMVAVVGAVGVYLIGCYSMYGEHPPPRCVPERRQLLERGNVRRVEHLPPPVPLTPTEAADIALWDAELR